MKERSDSDMDTREQYTNATYEIIRLARLRGMELDECLEHFKIAWYSTLGIKDLVALLGDE